jgi:hypothetical protein
MAKLRHIVLRRAWPGIGGLEDYGVKGQVTGAAHAAGRPLAHQT